MSTVTLLDDADLAPGAKAVFDDIRATRGTDYVNNFWRALAHDPGLLAETWGRVKRVMGRDSAIDAKTKEMIYIAVSVANSCTYCAHSHTAAARAKGMSEEEYFELLQIVALAAETNHLVTGLQVPVDDAFTR
jgi:AhpD family alkylhydroperoxidase